MASKYKTSEDDPEDFRLTGEPAMVIAERLIDLGLVVAPASRPRILYSHFCMGFQILQRSPRHLPLAAIRQQLGRVFQPHPLCARDFDPHLVGDIVDASGVIAH